MAVRRGLADRAQAATRDAELQATRALLRTLQPMSRQSSGPPCAEEAVQTSGPGSLAESASDASVRSGGEQADSPGASSTASGDDLRRDLAGGQAGRSESGDAGVQGEARGPGKATPAELGAAGSEVAPREDAGFTRDAADVRNLEARVVELGSALAEARRRASEAEAALAAVEREAAELKSTQRALLLELQAAMEVRERG